MTYKPVTTMAKKDFTNITLCKLLCYLYTDWIQNGYSPNNRLTKQFIIYIYYFSKLYLFTTFRSIVLKRSGFEKTPTACLPKIDVKINRPDKKCTTPGRDKHSQQNRALTVLIIKTRTRSAQPSTRTCRRTRPDKNLKLIYSTLLQTDLSCVIIAPATRNL